MRLLLDAHVLLWATDLSDRLRPETRDAIADPESEVFVSIATIWELSIKSNIGKLRLPPEFFDYLEPDGFQLLPVSLDHVRHFETLPLHHRDPFDRILVAQSACDGLTLVTRDPKICLYGIDILQA